MDEKALYVPKVRFPEFTGSWKQQSVGNTIKEVVRPILMNDDTKYQLVTVKRRNEGVVSRGYYFGRDILVKNYKEIHTDDYLISKRQIVHGANGLVPSELDKAVVSNEYMVCASDDITTAFLAIMSKTPKMKRDFFLSSYGVDIEKMVFDVNDWKKRSLIFPCLEEQQKIADFLTTVDEVISTSEQEVANLETQKKAVMKKIFSQEVRFKSTDGTNFPNWEKKSIKDFAQCIAGATPSTKVDDYWKGGTIPWMSSGEVNKGLVYDTDAKITQLGYDNTSTKMVPAETVVMALAGQGKTRGMVALTKIELCTNQSLCSIVSDASVNSTYLYQYLITQYQNLRHVSSGDGKRGGLNLKLVGEYDVVIPCLEEQRLIADFLSDFDEAIVTAKKELELWKKLKKGLLQQMFV